MGSSKTMLLGLMLLPAFVAKAAEVAGILDQHNVYRCMHGANPLTYNETLGADAQTWADYLAVSCGGLVHAQGTGQGENLASCAGRPTAPVTCSSGFDATPRWYDEIQYYSLDPATGNGVSTTAGEDIGHFTQVVWKGSTELGCASSACSFFSGGYEWFQTFVVCRYSPPGNYLGNYAANVDPTLSNTESECDAIIGGNGDPHMSGFKGQKFDFTGKDQEWYAVLHDEATSINFRITAPVPDVSAITYITGVGMSLLGTDGKLHTVEVVIDEPLDLDPVCSWESGTPCLADGAVSLVVDGKPAGVGEVNLGGGVRVSSLNLPGACRPFGFEKYWLEKETQPGAETHRNLRAAFSPAMWVMKDTKRTDPAECEKYLRKATAENAVFEHQSEHASLQITSPALSFRINVGKTRQVAMRDPTDQFDLPDHVAYQMNIAFDSVEVGDGAQGIVGGTTEILMDSEGLPIMSGHDCFRGEEESYTVSGALATGFTLAV